MRGNRFLHVLKIVVFVAVAITVFSFVTMHLWNWLMPAVFGLRTITWVQALGLLVLGKILFGGFHRHGGGCRGRRWKDRHGGAMDGDDAGGARTIARGMKGRWGCGFGPENAPAPEQKLQFRERRDGDAGDTGAGLRPECAASRGAETNGGLARKTSPRCRWNRCCTTSWWARGGERSEPTEG